MVASVPAFRAVVRSVADAGGREPCWGPARVVVALGAGSSADQAELFGHGGCVPVGEDGADLAVGEVDPEGALGAVALPGCLLRSHRSLHRSAMGDLSEQRVAF